MHGVCIQTGWDPEYAYEVWMQDIYDILFQDLEYFPEGPNDWKKDKAARIKALRGKR